MGLPKEPERALLGANTGLKMYELRTLENNKLVRQNFSKLENLISHLKTIDLKQVISVHQVEEKEQGKTSTQLTVFIEGDLVVLESPK